jgi:hypothetical protein
MDNSELPMTATEANLRQTKYEREAALRIEEIAAKYFRVRQCKHGNDWDICPNCRFGDQTTKPSGV